QCLQCLLSLELHLLVEKCHGHAASNVKFLQRGLACDGLASVFHGQLLEKCRRLAGERTALAVTAQQINSRWQHVEVAPAPFCWFELPLHCDQYAERVVLARFGDRQNVEQIRKTAVLLAQNSIGLRGHLSQEPYLATLQVRLKDRSHTQ